MLQNLIRKETLFLILLCLVFHIDEVPIWFGFLCSLLGVPYVHIMDTFDSDYQGGAHMSYSFPFLPCHSLKLSPKHNMVTPSTAAHPIHRVMLACPNHQGVDRSPI
jgi:hypothetical protein